MQPLRANCSGGCRQRNRRALVCVLLALLVLLPFTLAPVALAKDKPLVAILLFEGPSGPAYAQISELQINAKSEMLACAAGAKYDNSAYHKLIKLPLSTAVSMERDAAGVLTMKTAAGEPCVVPSNVKFEKNAQYSTKELADRALLTGRVVGKSSNAPEAIPEFKPGSKLVAVEAPDVELAEFLRAQRWPAIDRWRQFLQQYAAGAHSGEAKQSLVTLIATAGESSLAAYKKSVAASQPAFDQLHNARTQAEQALQVLPNATRAQKLNFDVRAEVQAIVTAGRNELKAFQTAVAEKTAGYEHLNQARARAGEALGADPAYDGAQRLSADVDADNQKLNQAIQTGESLVSSKRFDEAYSAILRYRSLAGEVPRVAAVVDAAFQYRRGLADGLVQEKKWQGAIEEYRRALNYKEDAATTEAMKKAQAELQLDQDKDTAAKAVAESEDLAAKKQYVEAYERLAALTPSQRSFANDEVDKLKAPYVDDAVKRAETLSRVHLPIRGRADEDGIRQGYRYLRQAAQLDAENEALKVKLDVFSDRVSDFYLKQAQQMFAKPRGSGVGLGWMFLLEAQRFKPDLNAIKDEMTKQEPIYETRSRLSLGLRLRDQTSRRDSVGFADQLSDSVSAGLEAAGVPALKMMSRQERPAGSDAGSAQEPNFQVLCDILQHKVTKTVDTQHVASHYRAGQHEVRNPAWAEAKRALDALQEQFNTANAQATALAVAKKRQSQEFSRTAQVLANQMTEARKKLDAIPETLLQDIIQPYNYTRRTFDVTGTVEFVFGVADSSGATPGQTTVKVEVPKKFKVVENVKPEDVDGVQEEGSPPDETQVLSDAETQAQAALIKKIVEKIRELPPRILEDARRKAAAKDSESAAEAYILYLNTTVNKDTPERAEAVGFLAREYNITATSQ